MPLFPPNPNLSGLTQEGEMRISRILVAAICILGLVLAVPATAGRTKTKKGTWTYTDFTPDPTTLQNPASQHCTGNIPAGPADENVHILKAPAKGSLRLVSHNQADWAMEIRTAKGTTIAGTDGADVDTPENMNIILRKGKYQIVYCSFAGEPQIEVDYTFKYRKKR
jgi:hypothetical protein